MKKLIFTLALLSAPAFLFAQGLGVGIKAGANFANLSIANVSTSSITRVHAGFYANIKFSEKWGITPEVLWSQQGAEFNGALFKTDYVTVPIMLRWRVIKLISLEVGPQFNILTNADYDGNDVKDQLNSNTYSLAAGALVHLPLGFNGGIRYIAGISDLSNNVDLGETKDKTVQLYIGWTIFGAK